MMSLIKLDGSLPSPCDTAPFSTDDMTGDYLREMVDESFAVTFVAPRSDNPR